MNLILRADNSLVIVVAASLHIQTKGQSKECSSYNINSSYVRSEV